MEKADREPDADKQKALRHEIRQQTVQLKRHQSLRALKTELARRIRTELDAQQILLAKWQDQIEQSITTLMESQVKLSVLKAEQGIHDVVAQLQAIEQKQLAGEQQFGEQSQWITQQIQQSFDSPDAHQKLDEALLQLQVHDALEKQLLEQQIQDVKPARRTHAQ
jgi:hypothetical protein